MAVVKDQHDHLLFIIGAAVAADAPGPSPAHAAVPAVPHLANAHAGSWQGYVFWPLFRSPMCSALPWPLLIASFPGLPAWSRLAAVTLLAFSIALFIYSFWVLGRDNSYGARGGLATNRIYRWTRNPQNLMLTARARLSWDGANA